jgi:penicillin-binding protein A
MNDISANIKKVMIVFLICFFSLISYVTYFEFFQGPKLINNPLNRRLWVKRNEILRGSIYDRDMNVLAKSTKIDSETQKREYSNGEVFAHALGYVDIRYGLTGLERKYDSTLMGEDSTNLSDVLNFFNNDKNKIGDSIQTTLNLNIQKQAFNLLGNKRGAVVVLNPKTGEILAMVSKPSFDPNNLKVIMDEVSQTNEKVQKKDKNIDNDLLNLYYSRPFINRATAGLYPPGSTFKTITAISAIENINDIGTRKIQDKGKLVFNSKESISNFNGEVLGNIGLKEAYTYSSNVFFGTIGDELGNAKLKATAGKFYFNKDTPAEGVTIENSIFPTFKNNELGNMAQSAIGQSEVLASPMEMALVASTIANDGVMMEPTLVKNILGSNGNIRNAINPNSLGTIISKTTANKMKDLMRAVVNSGTGTGAYVEGLNVCGKTGTADHNATGDELAVLNSSLAPHAWFIGFAPYDNPQVAVAVLVEDGGQGGIVAANIAAGVFKTALIK